MFDMAGFVEVKRLLEQVELVESKLTSNEREMFRSLLSKYHEPGHTDFDDRICLEVILRNVEVRKGFNFDPARDPGRAIELPRADRSEPETGGVNGGDKSR